MEFLPIKTRIVQPPKDEIWDIIDGLDVRDGDIVFITSKILGIHQGRTAKVGTVDKKDLIRGEASHILEYRHCDGFDFNLTITDNMLIANAGIDESNANGHYIMWPRDTDKLCAEIRARLIERSGAKRLGVVATDSHTAPLRWGVMGMTTGFAGVKLLKDMRGQKDLFGRKLHVTQVNQIDPLAAMAVLIMGEGNECTPIVILRGFDGVTFDDRAKMTDYHINPEVDIWGPLLNAMKKV